MSGGPPSGCDRRRGDVAVSTATSPARSASTAPSSRAPRSGSTATRRRREPLPAALRRDRRRSPGARRSPSAPAPLQLVESRARRRLPRLRGSVERLALEPFDPRVPVTELAAPLGVVEVREQCLRRRLAEPERPQAAERLVPRHAAIVEDSPNPDRSLTRRTQAAYTDVGACRSYNRPAARVPPTSRREPGDRFRRSLSPLFFSNDPPARRSLSSTPERPEPGLARREAMVGRRRRAPRRGPAEEPGVPPR